MEYYGNILCLTFSELTSCDNGEPVMTRCCYDSAKRRGSIIVVRPGKGLGNEALIEYSSLPEKYKEAVKAKYGDPERIMSRENEPLVMDNAAYLYFSQVRIGGRTLSDKLRDEYYLNASVLNRLIENMNGQKMGRNAGNNRTAINWDGIYQENERLYEVYGHTLPRSRRIQETIKAYLKDGYASLVSKKVGNTNRTKLSLGSPQGRWVIAQMRSRYPYKTYQDIFDEYQTIYESKGWKPIDSIHTFRDFLDDPKVKHMWADVKQGELVLRQAVQYQHDTMMPTVSGMLLYGDATKLNLYYKAYVNGKYKVATTMVYEVIDACSEVFLGCAIGSEENFELTYRAYRNAIEFFGHKPYENVTDGQGGTRRDDAQWFFTNLAMVSRYAAPYHGNSKIIESAFGRMQSQVLRKYDNYTGGNITAHSDRSKVDLEYIEENVSTLPTFDEMVAQYMTGREAWNNAPHPNQELYPGMTRMEVFNASINERYTPVLTEEMKRDIYMIPLRKEIKISQGGIKFEINGHEYSYTVKQEGSSMKPDLKWIRDNMGRQFEVHIDPLEVGTEGSIIRLYETSIVDGKKQRRFVTEATPKPVIHRAIGEQTDEERQYIREVERDVHELRVRMSIEHHEMDMEYGIAPEQHGRKTPQIKGLNKRYEQIADRLVSREQLPEPEPAEIYPDTVGQRQKRDSFADRM